MSHLLLRLTALPFDLSAYLREEGRLAVLVGVTARRDSGHQCYLALRPEADPSPDSVGALLTRRRTVPVG